MPKAYVSRVSKLCEDDTSDIIISPERNVLATLIIDYVSFYDEDNVVSGGYQIGIYRFGEEIPVLISTSSVDAGVAVNFVGPLYLGPEDRVYVRFNGGTEGDHINLAIFGHFEPQ